jgi:polar amino acid transport system substrate-binding protein
VGPTMCGYFSMKKNTFIRSFVPFLLCTALLLCMGLVSCAQTPARAAPAAVENARFAVITGTIGETFVESSYVKAEIMRFDALPDCFEALRSGKVDYVVTAYTNAVNYIKRYPDLFIFKNGLTDDMACIAVSKSQPDLLAKIDAILAKFKADGTLDEIIGHWIKPDGSAYNIVNVALPEASKGVLRVAISAEREPMNFVMDNAYAGLDIELIKRIAYELDMTTEFQNMTFKSLIASLASGKSDVIISSMSATDERRETVSFTIPYFLNPQVMVANSLHTGGTTGEKAANPGLFSALALSFEKNFIRENRWRLIISGLEVTLLIALLSAMFGSIFGFGVCLLRLRKNKAAVRLTAGFIRLVQGIPMVVLLMVFYYIIFGAIDINGIIVAVVAFSLNFGVYVSEIMRTGIEAVDQGQIEAALAMGFSKIQAFRLVTFPQAARHFLPVYKGELVSMVKATSIVGYIAIQDLTKASDIIRSRTYEAFFPIIMTAIIYFLLAWALTALLGRIEVRINPAQRKRIVKGVEP